MPTIIFLMMMLSLQVFFNVFVRFAKTEEYGYSVMDVGAGGFVVVNGFVEGRKRRCYK